MIINDSIFNEIVNVNRKLDNIKANGGDDFSDAQFISLSAIRELIGRKEIDPDELKDRTKFYLKHGDDKDGARAEAISDLEIGVWADGSLQLCFVPEDSILCGALKAYYHELDHENHYDHIHDGTKAIKGTSWIDDIRRYPRSGVPVKGSDASNIFRKSGFFFATGLGYDTNDELFSGVPIFVNGHQTHDAMYGVGSGYPSKKFLDFVIRQAGFEGVTASK